MPTKHSGLGPTAEVSSRRIPICSTLASLALTTLLAGAPDLAVAQDMPPIAQLPRVPAQ